MAIKILVLAVLLMLSPLCLAEDANVVRAHNSTKVRNAPGSFFIHRHAQNLWEGPDPTGCVNTAEGALGSLTGFKFLSMQVFAQEGPYCCASWIDFYSAYNCQGNVEEFIISSEFQCGSSGENMSLSWWDVPDQVLRYDGAIYEDEANCNCGCKK